MKYWSCCQRKTTEFQHFLDQEGCEIGVCKWTADKKGEDGTGCSLYDAEYHMQVLMSSVGMTGTRQQHM